MNSKTENVQKFLKLFCIWPVVCIVSTIATAPAKIKISFKSPFNIGPQKPRFTRLHCVIKFTSFCTISVFASKFVWKYLQLSVQCHTWPLFVSLCYEAPMHSLHMPSNPMCMYASNHVRKNLSNPIPLQLCCCFRLYLIEKCTESIIIQLPVSSCEKKTNCIT